MGTESRDGGNRHQRSYGMGLQAKERKLRIVCAISSHLSASPPLPRTGYRESNILQSLDCNGDAVSGRKGYSVCSVDDGQWQSDGVSERGWHHESFALLVPGMG